MALMIAQLATRDRAAIAIPGRRRGHIGLGHAVFAIIFANQARGAFSSPLSAPPPSAFNFASRISLRVSAPFLSASSLSMTLRAASALALRTARLPDAPVSSSEAASSASSLSSVLVDIPVIAHVVRSAFTILVRITAGDSYRRRGGVGRSGLSCRVSRIRRVRRLSGPGRRLIGGRLLKHLTEHVKDQHHHLHELLPTEGR